LRYGEPAADGNVSDERDRSHYVELAVALATDLERLASLRATLRQRMASSPLCDGQRLAGHLLTLLRGLCLKSGHK
jgi:predicted O-linked N-acetylglucosamine transferase (SPINDLY family)